MIETATDSLNLRELEELLQKRLLSASLSLIPLQISCLLRETTLMVLAHYPESALPYPQEVFPCLRQILEEAQISRRYQIQMYLIVHENNQLEAKKTAILADEISVRAVNLVADPKNVTAISYIKRTTLSLLNFKHLFSVHLNYRLPRVLAGTGISLLLVFYSLYALTRPCAIGQCQAITQAQQLVGKTSAFLVTSSELDLLSFQQDLTQAISVLKAMPRWSNYYDEAQSLRQAYQLQLADLKVAITAIKTGDKASFLIENSPFTFSQWQEKQQQLENAIADLEKLSSNSSLFAFAQVKIQKYYKNIDKINQDLKVEKQAVTSLDTAQQAVKMAQIRSNSAQSFSDWQSVYATWQTVIQRLREIPPETTTYQEAKQLLKTYTPQLTMAGVRKNQEQFALKIYHQAVHQAKLAEKAVSLHQWPAAANNWRKALTYLQKIPKTTFQSTQAQPLIAIYTKEFNQAEINLKEAIKLQKIRTELDKICTKVDKICDYTIGNNVIKVSLTSVYIHQVWQIALQAKAQANLQTQVELLNHISTLEQSLQAISNQTGKRVEVYRSDGFLMISYESRK